MQSSIPCVSGNSVTEMGLDLHVAHQNCMIVRHSCQVLDSQCHSCMMTGQHDDTKQSEASHLLLHSGCRTSVALLAPAVR